MNKKIWIIVAGVVILGILVIGGYLIFVNSEETTYNEIEPQEEISEEQMRQTIVTLYYQNTETKELMPEGKTVDVKNIFTDPYAQLINLLMETPNNEKLKSTIPTGTKLLKAELKGDIVYIDFSKEFTENHPGGKDAENATIYSITNTLTELNEVNGIKILINGQENQSFKDKEINFKDVFTRNE